MDEVTTKQDSREIEVASGENAPVPVKKVELDLDDAPFLQKDQPAPREDLDEVVADTGADDEARGKRKKRLLIIGAALGGILVITAVALWWFFFRTPPPLPPEAPKPEVVVVPSTPVPAPPQDLVTEFKPFVVPTSDSPAETRFLVCKFSAITRDPNVNQELRTQLVPLRDAIYYYLRSKDSPFLLDARNAQAIKQDLISVFNDYLSQGTLEDIVFESYLSR